MESIATLLAVFFAPAAFYSCVIGGLGLWRRDVQFMAALGVGAGVVWLAMQLLSGEQLAAFAAAPLVMIYLLATVAGFRLAKNLRCGHKEFMAEATERDELVA